MSRFNAKKARSKYAMPVWVDALMRDTPELTTEELGAYLSILCIMWTKESCNLPDDDGKLARIARVTPQKWKRRIRAAIEPLFIVDGMVWYSEKLLEEAAKTEKFLTNQSNRKTGNTQSFEAVPRQNGVALENKIQQEKAAKSLKSGNAQPTMDASAAPSTEAPIQETKSNNNSDDKSSSLLSAHGARNDDGYQTFLKAHPKPRDTDRGRNAWKQTVQSGIAPEVLTAAAKRYASVSATYDRDKMKFSDNWLIDGAWRKFQTPQSDRATQQEQLEYWASTIKSGRVFGLSEKWKFKCLQAGLVTKEEVASAIGGGK